jgi:hypothetical protein
MVVTTTTLCFQALNEKEEEMVENTPVETPSGDHLEADVDLEITKIASQNLTAFNGQGATKIIGELIPNDADEEERAEV